MTSLPAPKDRNITGQRDATGGTSESLSASYRSSMTIAGFRAAGHRAEIDHLRLLLRLRERSLSWRITLPLRWVRSLTLGQLPSGRPLREVPERVRGFFREREYRFSPLFSAFNGRKKPNLSSTAADVVSVYYKKQVTPKEGLLAPHVVIIAELSLAQCAKYRVWQKQEFLEALGWRVTVVDWRHTSIAWRALQTATRVIFYRTPAFDSVKALMAEARRLALSPWWEVDDLIIDTAEYRQNGNIDSLPESERRLLLFGVKLFREALLECGRGIASTVALAQAMRDVGVADVQVLENALDEQTLAFAGAARLAACKDGDRVWVCYGSGTNTHDADFRQALPGLIAAMREDARLCLRVFGDVGLPDTLAVFGDRVERRQGLDYKRYLGELAQTDIAIAPLEPTKFNDAKSNIKFLEASVLCLPSICSPRSAFGVILHPGDNGLFADTDTQWTEAFLRLARDPALRRTMGQRAFEDVMARYAPAAVIDQQARAIFGAAPDFPPTPRQPRVLMVNIYFMPRSFGGATIVVEELCRRLPERGVDLSVFTSQPDSQPPAEEGHRYQIEGLDVVAVPAAPDGDALGTLDNPTSAAVFADWLDAYRPDIVHVHAVQGFGVGLLRICEERGIPYVLTVHDAWWLCDRQFMVQANDRYCFQKTIDLRVCRECVPMACHLEARSALMHHALREAALVISPSETHRELYLTNGVDPERLVVNANGFRWPLRPRAPRTTGAPLRFGFVGGTENIKGYGLLRKAVDLVERSNWSLTLVDNKLNLGFHSIDPALWDIAGELRIRPAYTQEDMDDFYDEIDVLLFPSQWKESFGLTVREALARDVWVIATSPGGQAEAIEDGVNGTLIPIDNRPETLAVAIMAVIDDAARFETYTNPLKACLTTYEQQADHLRALYERVLS